MGKLINRVFIITGTASGMGKSISEHFLIEGAKVFGVSLESSCSIEHENFRYYSADITDLDSCDNIVNQAKKLFGKVDGLVNCAGITQEGNLETMSYDIFKKTFNVNVFGMFSMCKAAIIELKKQPSTILNISSNMAVKAIPDRVSYNASKAAVNMMTECIALDYAPTVRANTIMPGIVNTPMISKRLKEASDPSQLLKIYSNIYPLKRIGEVDDIVKAALFLSCDDSAWITGINLPVCGGDN